MALSKLIVTGTDTGVGKTLVAAGLCAWRLERGLAVSALKPVESGTDDTDGVPSDAALLARCSGQSRYQDCVVYALPEPLAPVVAARRASVGLDVEVLDRRYAELRAAGGTLIVEGVGGALVEVAPGIAVVDLAFRWHLPALVVAANRLGVLSHTLLTVAALEQHEVPAVGVVLNTVHGGEPTVAEQCNAEELARLLPRSSPLLGTVPWLSEDERSDPAALALAVDAVASILWSVELERGQ